MIQFVQYRREIFCLLLGITIFTSAWMASLVKDINKKGVNGFSIMQLELPKDDIQLQQTVSALREHDCIAEITKNLKVDYTFMFSTYIGIAVWLLISRRGTKGLLSMILLLCAVLQILPWIFDITENNHLLKVVANEPLGMDLNSFKTMVLWKFYISLGGTAVAIIVVVGKLFRKSA